MGNRILTRATDIETGRNTPQKWDRLRLLPRHIRTSLPLLPSGPGGVRAFVIARSPKPDIRISNFIFEFRAKKRRERDSNPHRPFGPPRFQRGAIPIRRSLRNQTRRQGDKGKLRRSPTVSPSHCPLVSRSFYSGGEGGIRTHGTRKGTTVFETARFSHSRTSPHKSSLIPHHLSWEAIFRSFLHRRRRARPCASA